MRNITRQSRTKPFPTLDALRPPTLSSVQHFFTLSAILTGWQAPPKSACVSYVPVIDTAEGEELEKAILELRSAITALIDNAHNVSTYNLINFPVAMDKRRKV